MLLKLTGKNSQPDRTTMIGSTGIAVAMAIAGMFGFAQYVRRSSMFFPDRYPLGQWDTSSLPVRPEEHRIDSGGHALHAWLFRAGESSAAPLIIFCHGNAGNITGRGPIGAELARRGISVLVFDWRGYGKSAGRATESGLHEDALAAYDYAEQALGAKKIVMYGESLGGPYAAYVASKRRVQSVIIENSFPSLRQLGNTIYAPIPLGWTAPFALTTSRWLNEAGVPVLIMHGRGDQVIPFRLGQRLHDELRVPKQFLISETAGHCELAYAEGERYYQAVTEFVKSYH